MLKIFRGILLLASIGAFILTFYFANNLYDYWVKLRPNTVVGEATLNSGRVIHKRQTRSLYRKAEIHFSYLANGEVFTSSEFVDSIGWYSLNIGDKFEIRYVPENPLKYSLPFEEEDPLHHAFIALLVLLDIRIISIILYSYTNASKKVLNVFKELILASCIVIGYFLVKALFIIRMNSDISVYLVLWLALLISLAWDFVYKPAKLKKAGVQTIGEVIGASVDKVDSKFRYYYKYNIKFEDSAGNPQTVIKRELPLGKFKLNVGDKVPLAYNPKKPNKFVLL